MAAASLVMAFFVGTAVPEAEAALATNMSADVVVGQTDFTSRSSNQGGSAGANTISLVPGVWSDGKKLIMADIANDRVTIFNSFPTANDASADVVIGQPDMNTSDPNLTAAANNLNSPYGVFFDGQKLFVADANNNRVLIYNSIPTANGASADVVVGQTDMTGSSANQGGSVAANTLGFPEGVYSDGVRLFIADSLNNRVLVYNSIPTANGASADYVIGQTDLDHNGINQGGSVGANTLFAPTSVFAHSGKLFIADDANDRVLIYNSIPTASNPNADVVVGQADMNSNSANQGGSPDANTISDPYSVMSDGTRLIISERSNHRVSIFNSIPTANNARADYVIGQPDFTSNSLNQGGSVAANTLYAQGQAYFAAGKLIVGDALNSRALIFSIDAARIWRTDRFMSIYGGIKGKLRRTRVTFSGKKTSAKRGHVFAYENGVLKKTAKIKKSGKWKFSFSEKPRSVNKLLQFRFTNSANQLVAVSDQFNFYLAGKAGRRTLEKQTIPQTNADSSQPLNKANPETQKNDVSWPDLKF